MCIFNAGLRLNQAISLWKNQRKCPRLWGSKTGNTGVLFPLTEERGEKIFRKKVATHPVAQEVSPKVQFGLKKIDHFWDAATRMQEQDLHSWTKREEPQRKKSSFTLRNWFFPCEK